MENTVPYDGNYVNSVSWTGTYHPPAYVKIQPPPNPQRAASPQALVLYRKLYEEILNTLIEENDKKINLLKSSPYDIEDAVRNYTITDLNLRFYPSNNFIEKYKTGFYKFGLHQANPMSHPYTCGIDSEHAALVYRVGVDGKGYILCPTCGYIQPFPMFD